MHLVYCSCQRQPGPLASRQSGALVTNPRAITGRQRFDIHIESTCLQHLLVAFLLKLQGNQAFL